MITYFIYLLIYQGGTRLQDWLRKTTLRPSYHWIQGILFAPDPSFGIDPVDSKAKIHVQILFRYWTEEAYFWNLGSSAWGSKGKRMNAFHRWAHFNDPRFDYRNPRYEFVPSDNVPERPWGGRITYDRNSDLTLKATNRYQERNKKSTFR